MAVGFVNSIDIANRACQHVGVDLIDTTVGFTEVSRAASNIGACYDKLRRAELQRNTWRFATRRVILRAIDANTRLLAPTLYASGTTYFVGSIVEDQNSYFWISKLPANVGNDPTTSPTAWEPYFGPLSVSLLAASTSYSSGELVYTTAGDGTYRVYLSLQSANSDTPATATAYDATVTYTKDDVVTYSGVPYLSLIDFNLAQTPNVSPTKWTTTFVGGTGSMKWREIGGTDFPAGVALAAMPVTYPLGAGPSPQASTRSIYRLPAGFLRHCSQDPKAGATSYLGAPSGLLYSDWLFEGNWIVTADTGPIMLRFVADVTDVSSMDDMFCEGLGARIGLEVCQVLTQSGAKLNDIAKMYQKFMGEARTINAIETGSEEAPIDDWVACRA